MQVASALSSGFGNILNGRDYACSGSGIGAIRCQYFEPVIAGRLQHPARSQPLARKCIRLSVPGASEGEDCDF
jgi:hypothetical protein